MPVSASAHMTKPAGKLLISFGWGDEPPFTSAKNFVEVGVADKSGAPIEELQAELRAEVTFGSERVELPLEPTEEPSELRASIVPTRPGTYAFRITGTANGQTIDVGATCSEKTFECVSDISEIQFPAKEPSAGQLADRLTRELPRVEAQASDDADDVRLIAIAALVVATLALIAAIVLGVMLRRSR
jgi:hypothetical protein